MRAMLVGVAVFTFAPAALAAPSFDDVSASGEKGGDKMETFAPDAPAVFVHAKFKDIASGSTVTCVFIAEDTHGAAPANYKIDSVDFKVGTIENVIDCSLSKPNGGWPVGSYRVDLTVDGNVVTNAKFVVAK